MRLDHELRRRASDCQRKSPLQRCELTIYCGVGCILALPAGNIFLDIRGRDLAGSAMSKIWFEIVLADSLQLWQGGPGVNSIVRQEVLEKILHRNPTDS